MTEQLRIGVIGAGLIGQAVHIPTLRRLDQTFVLVAVADPSEKVRTGLSARYPEVKFHADWRSMLEAETLDAVLVCSPHATHAEITLAALDLGLHVFVEKPLAITLNDIDQIERRRLEKGLVVQVGYMKRFDAGYESLLDVLPATAEDLRLIDVVTYDPWMARTPFAPSDLIIGDDVPEALRVELAKLEREQVEAEVGVDDPTSVKAFSQVYLQALIHDVNLVHGVLEHLCVDLPLLAITSAHWAAGEGAHAVFALPNGARWQTTWLLLDGQNEFRETASFYLDDRIQRLQFDVPYLRERPTTLVTSEAGDHGRTRQTVEARADDPYAGELRHFHDCITKGISCRTPPTQARIDQQALVAAFLAQGELPEVDTGRYGYVS